MPANPAQPQPVTFDGRLAQRVADLERQVSALSKLVGGGASQFPVVDVLPPAGRIGRGLVLSTDQKLYVDNGTSWVAQT